MEVSVLLYVWMLPFDEPTPAKALGAVLLSCTQRLKGLMNSFGSINPLPSVSSNVAPQPS